MGFWQRLFGQKRSQSTPPVRSSSSARTPVSEAVVKLCDAARDGSTVVVRSILEGGVDPNIQDEVGFTPLAKAALEGKHEVVKLLLDFGADVETCTLDGSTPLYYAVTADFYRTNVARAAGWQPEPCLPPDDVLRTVEVLLAKGAKANTVCGNTSILMMAVIWCAEPVVRRLLEAGADPNLPVPGRDSPLEWARREKREDIVKLLLENGAPSGEVSPD